MFDSLLNSKFYNRCKHAFKCIRTRLVPIRRKKEAMVRFLKKDVAELLTNGLDTYAFGRMDGLIMEMNHASCYDMIGQYCDYIGKQLNSLQKQRDCPQETREAVSTLIFAAARFPDLPELCDLRHIFTERYGNFLDPFVSLEFAQKLDSELFTNEEKFQVMQNIAEEFSVGFDRKSLEIKLWAAPEAKHDLLGKDSAKQIQLDMPLSNKHKEDEDATYEKKSEARPVGYEEKPEAQLEQKLVQDVQVVIANGTGRLNDNTRRQHSDISCDKGHLEKSESPLERKSEDPPVDHKLKLEALVEPKAVQDVQAVANGIGELNGNTRRKHSEKSDDKEHLEKSVSPLEMKRRNAEKAVQKANKKDVRPCEKELMEAVELDLNGLPKQEFGPLKFPETESNKTVPLNAKPKEARKEHDIEKENDKGRGYQYGIQRPGGPDHIKRNANLGFKDPGLENQGLGSVYPSHGNVTNGVPPYAKLNGAKGKSCAEKEEKNGLTDLRHPMQRGPRVTERATNMRPPYVKPKLSMHPVNDDPAKRTASGYSKHGMTEQADHLSDKDASRPVSVRRKKPPAAVDGYAEAVNTGKVTSRTPSSDRQQSNRQKGDNDDYDRRSKGVEDDVGNGKNVQRTPSSRPGHSGRRNGALYHEDYDGFMERHRIGNDETAIDFGNLLPQTAKGHRRLKTRNTNVGNGDLDEEERMMDKLLMHYSKKGLDTDEAKTRTETNRTFNGNGSQAQCQQNGSMHPPGRAVSLPPEPVTLDENVKVPARSTSLQPDCPGSVRVHPKMPDFDELAARVTALRKA